MPRCIAAASDDRVVVECTLTVIYRGPTTYTPDGQSSTAHFSRVMSDNGISFHSIIRVTLEPFDGRLARDGSKVDILSYKGRWRLSTEVVITAVPISLHQSFDACR